MMIIIIDTIVDLDAHAIVGLGSQLALLELWVFWACGPSAASWAF